MQTVSAHVWTGPGLTGPGLTGHGPTGAGGDRVQRALEAVAAGRPVVVTDDEDRENEGDLIFAAELASPELMAFMVRYTSGYVCVALPGSECERLGLPQMHHANSDSFGTAYAVTVDAVEGITTGISAADRACTARALADPTSTPRHFARPGHVVPLRAREGGVLRRKPFRRLVKWRTGAEGRISHLKHRYGLDRTRLDGLDGAKTWSGLGVLTHNTVKIAGLVEAKQGSGRGWAGSGPGSCGFPGRSVVPSHLTTARPAPSTDPAGWGGPGGRTPRRHGLTPTFSGGSS